ncbi:hypothetical protein [Thermus tengchongensis]|nr:hypothetical protein [Thermus tengchongensis]
MSFQDGVQLGAGFVVGALLVWIGLALILAIIGALLGVKKE